MQTLNFIYIYIYIYTTLFIVLFPLPKLIHTQKEEKNGRKKTVWLDLLQVHCQEFLGRK